MADKTEDCALFCISTAGATLSLLKLRDSDEIESRPTA
jgi:hypothetical protein